MTTLEFFRSQFKAERAKFLNVIRALPEGKLDYKPHERNSSAGAIAWFLVLELRALVEMIRTHENRWQQLPRPETTEQIAAAYDQAAGELEAALASTTEAAWEEKARMYFGDHLIKSAPLGETVWDFFFDAVHHRGQLCVYIRPMGGKVPAVYGPSGDAK